MEAVMATSVSLVAPSHGLGNDMAGAAGHHDVNTTRSAAIKDGTPNLDAWLPLSITATPAAQRDLWPASFSLPLQATTTQPMAALASLAALAADDSDGKRECQDEQQAAGKQNPSNTRGGGRVGSRGKRDAAQFEFTGAAALTTAARDAALWIRGPGSVVGDVEAVLHVLAQVQEGQSLTVVPMPAAVSACEASKRPRRAAARGALAVLQAEHSQVEMRSQAAVSELEGRLFHITVSGAPSTAPMAQRLSTMQQTPAAPQAEPMGRPQCTLSRDGSGPSSLQAAPRLQMEEQQQPHHPEFSRAAGCGSVPLAGAASCSLEPASSQPVLREAKAIEPEPNSRAAVQQQAAVASLEQQQQQQQQEGVSVEGETQTGAALPVTAFQLTSRAARQQSCSAPGGSGNGQEEEEVTEEGEEEEEEISQPGSPTASEAALLGELMQHPATAAACSQAEEASTSAGMAPIGTAAASAKAAAQQRQRRGGGRVSKRKGGMPPVCPGCGKPPLSEEDKRAAAKRGRRKKNDESDPRNRKAELTRDFLVAHLVVARLSLRDICYYHGHCATTVSRVARNLGMDLPSWRTDRKDSSQLPADVPDDCGAPAESGPQAAVEQASVADSGRGERAPAAKLEELPVVAVLGAAAEADAVAQEALQALEAAGPRFLGAVALPTVLVTQKQQGPSPQQQQQSQLQQRQHLAAALARAVGSTADDAKEAVAAAIEAATQAAATVQGAAAPSSDAKVAAAGQAIIDAPAPASSPAVEAGAQVHSSPPAKPDTATATARAEQQAAARSASLAASLPGPTAAPAPAEAAPMDSKPVSVTAQAAAVEAGTAAG